MIPALLLAAKKEFRERFKKPERDKSTGLYIVPSASPVKETPIFVAKI
jgi:hypothetical protein